jgi:hypothetical protein
VKKALKWRSKEVKSCSVLSQNGAAKGKDATVETLKTIFKVYLFVM